MIAIIDYDAGNVKSVEKAIEKLGGEYVLTSDPNVIEKADAVILPGVGNFGDCMDKLISRGLSPGGSADMLALALLLEHWQALSVSCV